MKVKLNTKIDTTPLNRALLCGTAPKDARYIMMSTATAKGVLNSELKTCNCVGLPQNYIAEYNGYKVYTDDDLPFGTVDIR